MLNAPIAEVYTVPECPHCQAIKEAQDKIDKNNQPQQNAYTSELIYDSRDKFEKLKRD